MSMAIHYSIYPQDPYAHLFAVSINIDKPDASGQLLRLPTWIPGSYMIRDFARNVIKLSARSNDADIQVKKIDKSTWKVEPCEGPLCIEYQVYAWDLSVRAAHLDQTHAYFNGTSVFLEVVGQAESPCLLDIKNASIAEAGSWKVATSLVEESAARYGFGTYSAENYDDLIDHPVEICDFTLAHFEAAGVQHDFVLAGKHYADVERICRDLKKICEYQINFFGKPAPVSRYVFITWVVGDGYGGLEHRASTSLICSRADLPIQGEEKISDGYKTFLGLCSHEYFHTWNVKRIKPDSFLPYQLDKESHTPLLWAFEGITSYYDDLILNRCGLISDEEYLQLVAKNLTRVLRNPGRFNQSISESSFDAWTKFYKQDENAINGIVSYYTKGSVAAMGLDLLMRDISSGAVSLDHVMQRLWQNHGKTLTGVAEFDIQNICFELLGGKNDELQDYFSTMIYGTADYPLEQLFEKFGVQMSVRIRENAQDTGGAASKPDSSILPWLGATIAATNNGESGVKLVNVIANGPAHRCGLSANDVIIAIDGLKISKDTFERQLRLLKGKQCMIVHAFRDDVLMQFEVSVENPPADTVFFTVADDSKIAGWLSAL